MSRRRSFSQEFKLEVCQQLATGEKRPAQVCREHQLAASLLYRWRQQYEQHGASAFNPGPATELEVLERQVAELERFCGQLALENQVLSLADCPLAERHAVISQAHALHPELSIQRLCRLLGVSRSWFYAQRSQSEATPETVALRQAIEAIVLEFPGYHPQGGYPTGG